MKWVLSLFVAVSLTVETALSKDVPATTEPTLQVGITQFNEGDLAGAVFTLEAVVRTLAVEAALHGKELSEAYLYRGAAFVGLGQEKDAKESFAAALQYDKGLRITEDKFPPRVVRVFEAARAGKTKSVMLPPRNIVKKGGIGALGIAGIIAGIVAVSGGVAAATRDSSPAPTPSPTPDTSTMVLPITGSGPVQITFVNADPPPGSTISGCGPTAAGCNGRLRMVLRLRSDVDRPNLALTMTLYSQGSYCGLAGGTSVTNPPLGLVFDLRGGESFDVGFSFVVYCVTPFQVTRMVAQVTKPQHGNPDIARQEWSLRYTFAP